MTEQAEKYRQAAEQMEGLAELDEEEEEVMSEAERQLGVELKSIFFNQGVLSEHEEIVKLSTHYNINASEARKQLNTFPD